MTEGPRPRFPDAGPAQSGGPAFDALWLADAVGGRIEAVGSRPIRGGSVDSRRTQPGNAFFALPGERADGHDFLEAAVQAGAAALVIREPLGETRLAALAGPGGGVTIVRVDDVGAALLAAASAWRDRFSPAVVGITGSIAKTSTKEQAAVLLGSRFRVLHNEGNENNEIGLPLTLLRLTPEHEVAVLEMGLYTPGDIALLARVARPEVGIVTAVRGVHLSRAGSIEAIERGKRELVEALPPSGWAILNADDPLVAAMAAHTAARALRYGFDPAAEVGAEGIVSHGPAGMSFRLRLPEGGYDVRTPALGRHGVHNALAAAAAATCLGMDGESIARGLARVVRLPHRSLLVAAGAWTILDDTYNASPDTMVAALDLLADLPGRHIAVLGEMLELGATSEEGHLWVGAHAARRADRLVVVGAGAAGIAVGARQAGLPARSVVEVADREAALAWLLGALRPGDSILLKASRGVALDLLVEELARAGGEGAPA